MLEDADSLNALVTACKEGWLLRVRAQPAAKSNALRGVRDGALLVSVTQAPEKGKANKAIAEVLAKALGIKKSQIQLAQGATSSLKQFLVVDVGQGDLLERIRRAAGD